MPRGRVLARPGAVAVRRLALAGAVAAAIVLALAVATRPAFALATHPVGAPAARAGAGTASAAMQRAVSDLFQLDRMLGYLAIAVLCGGWGFIAVVWPEAADRSRTRWLLMAAWLIGFVTSVAGFALQGAMSERRGLSSLYDATQLSHTLGSQAGRAWAARGLLFLLALPLVAALASGGAGMARTRWWQASTLVVGLGIARAPGLSGHSLEGVHGVAGSVADLAHVAAMATWVGGLALMAVVVLPQAAAHELATVVPRFSRVAAASVAVLVIAGAVLAWDIAGGLHPLIHTHYGRLLGIKVLVLAAALLAASASKRWTDSRLRLAVVLRGDRITVRPFAISVAAEALLAVAVLGVASVLVSTSPGI